MSKAYPWVRAWFACAAAYDFLLGVFFLIAPFAAFERFGVIPPNHPGYVQFPAALLVIFALMFAAVARDPARYRSLILFGILLKVSYCGVIFFYWIVSGIPVIWKPFAIADLIFLVTFWAAYLKVKPMESPGSASATGPY